MNCPHCAAPVPKGADVCPACHNAIAAGTSAVHVAPVPDEDGTWCKSCGSPVPEGREVCPVCGMPVEGAYDEAWGEDAALPDPTPGEGPQPRLESAIPPVPEAGDDGAERQDARSHLRLVMVAALAALLVVGGTALYITRPWDPDAYRTHAVEDADTSQEGFPGTVTHLEGQDLIEDAERKQYLADAERTIDDFLVLMREVGDECASLEEPVETYLTTGILEQGPDGLATAREASERLSASYDKVAALDLNGSDYEDRQGAMQIGRAHV